MATIVTLDTQRSGYDIKEVAEKTMTVGELISYLEQYDEDTRVVYCNDNGYTYGAIKHYCIGEEEIGE